MDELTTYLLSDRKGHATISPEALELMGKQAANMFLDEGRALNDCIIDLAGEHQDINAEQIKRVVEFANQSVYLGLHDKAKTAGSKQSYPQFELADAGEIIRELTAEATPVRTPQVDVDYGRAPVRMEKMAEVAADNLLADLFKVKEASAHLDYTKESVVNEIVGVKEDLTSLRDHLTHAASNMDMMWKEAQEEFYDRVKRHLLDEGSFADVIAAARIPGVPFTKVAATLKPFMVRLFQEKVATPNQLRSQVDGFDKVAHRVVNTEHPLVTSFRAYLSLDQEIEKVAMGLKDIEIELGRVNAFIREHLVG
jgi:hypothetical protein